MADAKKEAAPKEAPKKAKKAPAAYKPGKACPKCGSRMGEHANRNACGKCGYTELKSAAPKGDHSAAKK
ncbi:MAG: 30S ribosomal protein S27ae [Candidatus Micrarchaeota archaeon]|nr:30S ribosomal protein S27ae [Candidatus Micrarchaeota archaeon]